MEVDLVSDSSDDSLPAMLNLSVGKEKWPTGNGGDLNAAVYELSSSSEMDVGSENFVVEKTRKVPGIRRKLSGEEKERKLDQLEAKRREKVKQREAKEEEKRLRNEANLAAKRDKEIEKERNKLLKKIESESNRNFKPDQSIKFVKVVIDSNLMELAIGQVLAGLLESQEIRYEVRKQPIPNCITWKREVVESSLSQDMGIEIDKNEKDEDEILIYLTLEDFLSSVYAFKENCVESIGNKETLISRAKIIKRTFPNKKITFIVEGYERYARGQKSSTQRKFRGAVLETNENRKKNKKSNISVTDVDVEESVVAVLVQETCNVRLVNSSADIASTVQSFTKSIAAAPYKQAKYTTQGHLQMAADNSKAVKVKDSSDFLLLWQKQIETFNMVNADIAQTITNKYPSPTALLRAYDQCLCNREREKLLQDLIVRRGVGPLANTRRIGPELSRKLCLLFTSKNPDLNLQAN